MWENRKLDAIVPESIAHTVWSVPVQYTVTCTAQQVFAVLCTRRGVVLIFPLLLLWFFYRYMYECTSVLSFSSFPRFPFFSILLFFYTYPSFILFQNL